MSTLKEDCFCHLLALKYKTAGDLECLELLNQVEERLRIIPWDDPKFIEFSDQMRIGGPPLTPEQEELSRPSLLALLHEMAERITGDNENAARLMPSVKKLMDQYSWALDRALQYSKFSSSLLDLHDRMLDRLQMLGDDTTEFRKLPKL